MRLTFVVSSLGAGGTERVVATLAGALGRRGHTVTVATLAAAKPFFPLDPVVTHLPLGIARDTQSLREALANNARTIAALRKAFRALRPERILSFGDTTNIACLLGTIAAGTPVIAAERSNPALYPEQRAWRALRRLMYPRAAAVVVQTQGAADWHRACGLRRLAVIPNPVAPPPTGDAPRFPEGGHLLLGIGRLGPEKGFDVLIEAFSRLAPRFPEWRLSILGEGPLRAALSAAIARHGLESRIRLPGVSADPFAACRQASLFALPSRTEGFPNALLEAMACGTAVVAADCPFGPSEIVHAGVDGLLAPPGDAPAFSEALGALMGDAERRSRLGAAARAVATRYSLERILPLWESLLAAPRA